MKKSILILLMVCLVTGCEKKEPQANLEEIFQDPGSNIAGPETKF